MKIKVIHNPYSARWTSSKRRPEAEAALQAQGLDYDWVESSGPGHAIELAKNAVKDGYGTIIAAGGDGTIGEVANGIMQAIGENAPPNLGILPLGTANDLVHNLGLPTDLNQMAEVIVGKKTKLLDVCRVNDRYFVNNAGLGLEPYTTAVQENMQRVQGTMRYLLATLISIMHNPQWEMQLEWDGGAYQGPVTLVSIGNGAVTGGLFYTVPHADPFDGKLTFVYGHIASRFKILQVLPRTMKPDEGNYTEHPNVHQHHCTWLKVSVQPTTPAHSDGELFDRAIKELHYTILPAKLPVFIR